MNSLLKIAARHSDLARLQAYRVGETLVHLDSALKVEYAFRASLGDQNLNDPLWRMPEKGVFTEDFINDLVEESADCIVHSWKDLPTEPRPQTEVVATLERADMRDVFLLRRDRFKSVCSSGRLKIFTSSPRRTYNLESFFRSYLPFAVTSVVFESVRGNIPTRIRKLFSSDVDGLIVAKAALDRLLEAREPEFAGMQTELRQALAGVQFMVLPLTINPTAAAQGALAVEIKRGRPEILKRMKELNSESTWFSVQREREILASYGGGCHQKIGVSVLSRPYGTITFLRGLTDAGQTLKTVELRALDSSPKIARARSAAEVFPAPSTARARTSFFTREALPREAWSGAERSSALWVARHSAWPDGFKAQAHSVIWCAGLSTWRALAKKGVWVHGCAESLGETESTRIETLASTFPSAQSQTANALEWVKLTHDCSRASVGMHVMATYRLRPNAAGEMRETIESLRRSSHFYWMSGSSFDRALELVPEIRDRIHVSGPGSTHAHLEARLGRPVAIALSLADFYKSCGVDHVDDGKVENET